MSLLATALLGLLASTTSSTPGIQASLEQRTRAEGLHRRVEDDVDDNATDAGGLFARTVGRVDVDASALQGTLELVDARALLHGAASSTSHVDTLDLLQANVGLRLDDVGGGTLTARLGRQTLDVGSRRLVARNEFRNTINTFTGVDVDWAAPTHSLRAFIVTPVRRLPEGGDAAWQPDLETGARFVGATAGVRDTDVDVLLTGLWLDEGDVGDQGRRLLTMSMLLRRAPRPGQFDAALEVMPQLGEVRGDDGVRARRAIALHASVGRTFDVAGRPRLSLAFDHASGDDRVGDDADDTVDEAFDPLFGARRFELGPTGLFGPLARTNLSSPGIRLELAPGPEADLLVAGRAAWAATGAGAIGSGKAIPAALLESRLRAWPRGALVPELGVAAFVPSAIGGAAVTTTFFAYAQLVARFQT